MLNFTHIWYKKSMMPLLQGYKKLEISQSD